MSGASIALNIVRKQYREIREALVGDGLFTHTEVLQKAFSVYDDSQELLKVQDRLAELQDYHAALLHWVMYHLDKDEGEVKEMIYE
tara:strand:- start:49 stop:306 length:258 start_codon:yes stop_codon:yes gene_type:complete